MATGETVQTFTAGTGTSILNQIKDLAFSPDGKYVLTGSLNENVQLWDALTGKEVLRIVHQGTQSGGVWSLPTRRTVPSWQAAALMAQYGS